MTNSNEKIPAQKPEFLFIISLILIINFQFISLIEGGGNFL